MNNEGSYRIDKNSGEVTKVMPINDVLSGNAKVNLNTIKSAINDGRSDVDIADALTLGLAAQSKLGPLDIQGNVDRNTGKFANVSYGGSVGYENNLGSIKAFADKKNIDQINQSIENKGV